MFSLNEPERLPALPDSLPEELERRLTPRLCGEVQSLVGRVSRKPSPKALRAHRQEILDGGESDEVGGDNRHEKALSWRVVYVYFLIPITLLTFHFVHTCYISRAIE